MLAIADDADFATSLRATECCRSSTCAKEMQVTTDDLSGFKEKETNNIRRYVYLHVKQTNARRGQEVTYYIIMVYRYYNALYYYYYYYDVAQQAAASEVLGNL